MTHRARQVLGDSRGYSLVELLVALVVFVLLVLAIDVVFATVNRSSRTAELAADVAQNARVAMERLTREVRFSRPSEIQPSPLSASPWVAFKSARLSANPTVFCLDVANTADTLYNAACSPPLTGTYAPVWQSWIVYCFNAGVLRRDEQPIAVSPSQTLCETDGDIIAASSAASSFSVTLSGSVLTVTLDLEATERVQGSNVPSQRITLTSQTFIRN